MTKTYFIQIFFYLEQMSANQLTQGKRSLAILSFLFFSFLFVLFFTPIGNETLETIDLKVLVKSVIQAGWCYRIELDLITRTKSERYNARQLLDSNEVFVFYLQQINRCTWRTTEAHLRSRPSSQRAPESRVEGRTAQ